MYLTRRITKISLGVMLSLLSGLCVCLASKTLAQNPFTYYFPYYWDYINVRIEVQSNGDLLISERQKYVFTKPYSNQRYRYIPLDKVDGIKDIAVKEDGQELVAQTGIKNNQMWIKWQHPLNPPEEHTFELTYRVVGGLQISKQGDRVYWKAIFPDRSEPIRQSTIIVKLPDSLAHKITSFKSYGVPTSSAQIDSRTVRYVALETINLCLSGFGGFLFWGFFSWFGFWGFGAFFVAFRPKVAVVAVAVVLVEEEEEAVVNTFHLFYRDLDKKK